MTNQEQYAIELEKFIYNQFIERVAKEILLHIQFFSIKNIDFAFFLIAAKDEVIISTEKTIYIWSDVFDLLQKKL